MSVGVCGRWGVAVVAVAVVVATHVAVVAVVPTVYSVAVVRVLVVAPVGSRVRLCDRACALCPPPPCHLIFHKLTFSQFDPSLSGVTVCLVLPPTNQYIY